MIPQREVTFFHTTWLIVGLVLGVGIYETSPLIAQSVQSPRALYLLWIFGGFLTVCGGLTYSALAVAYPEDGGDYNFLKRSFGSLVGFLYCWSQIFLIRPGAIAAISFPCVSHLRPLLPNYLDGIADHNMAILVIVACTIINLFGMRAGIRMQTALSMLSYLPLLLLACAGIFLGGGSDLQASSEMRHMDLGLGLILVLFSFGGWSEVALIAGEIKDPRRNFLPAMLTGIGLITLLYIILNYSFVQRLGFHGLMSSSTPATQVFPQIGSIFIALMISFACLSSLHGLILSGSRISYAYGKDYPFLGFLANINRSTNSPMNAVVVQAMCACFFVYIAQSFASILVYTTAIVWIFYFLVGLSIFYFHRKGVFREEGSQLILFPIAPLIFCISSLYLVYASILYDPLGTLWTLLFIVVGVPVFYLQAKTKGQGNMQTGLKPNT